MLLYLFIWMELGWSCCLHQYQMRVDGLGTAGVGGGGWVREVELVGTYLFLCFVFFLVYLINLSVDVDIECMVRKKKDT